jgi:hypothetical protein
METETIPTFHRKDLVDDFLRSERVRGFLPADADLYPGLYEGFIHSMATRFHEFLEEKGAAYPAK